MFQLVVPGERSLRTRSRIANLPPVQLRSSPVRKRPFDHAGIMAHREGRFRKQQSTRVLLCSQRTAHTNPGCKRGGTAHVPRHPSRRENITSQHSEARGAFGGVERVERTHKRAGTAKGVGSSSVSEPADHSIEYCEYFDHTESEGFGVLHWVSCHCSK